MSIKKFYSSHLLIDDHESADYQQLQSDCDQCIFNLHAEIDVKSAALQTAETLIANYIRENNALLQENAQIIQQNENYQNKLKKYERTMIDFSNFQHQLLPKASKINELLQKVQYLEKKNRHLKKQITETENRNQKEFQTLRRLQHADKQIKNAFQTHLKAPRFQNSFLGRLEVERDLINEIQLLNLQLSQKDQEMLMMFRRNKVIEDKYVDLLKETGGEYRFKTCSTELGSFFRYNRSFAD